MLLHERLGPFAGAVDATVGDLAARKAVRRLHDRDHTLWQDDPAEVADRLGWLDCPATMRSRVASLDAFAEACRADGLDRAVVLGMGGSSLFPEVLARTFGSRPDRLDLSVLDTTHPSAVARVQGEWPAPRTLYVAASKSGSTIETRSHLERFWTDHPVAHGFAVVTDPGSSLGDLARSRGFREIFENPPDIGGRYSALSLFGLVPAALAGVPGSDLLAGADAVLPDLQADEDANPGVRLGAAMAAAAKAGRDKLTLVLDPRIAAFGLWVEQLIAESTGKHGRGVLPIVGEPLGPPAVYGDDRLFVAVGQPDPGDGAALDALAGAGHPVVELPLTGGVAEALGAQVLLWEVATALCGAALGINPFDQPDVAAAKAATQAVLDAGDLPEVPVEPVGAALSGLAAGDYVAVHAYVDPHAAVVDELERARVAIRDEHAVATTIGLGPRFLHSTGQLHKGGPPRGVFLQVVDAGDPGADVAVPGAPYTFGTLLQAQAAGDLATLRERGLRAARVSLDELVEVGRR